MVKLYEPLNTLKPVGEDLWVVDGPLVRMAYLGGSMPFPTRMAVIRLMNRNLFLWSPTQPHHSRPSECPPCGHCGE